MTIFTRTSRTSSENLEGGLQTGASPCLASDQGAHPEHRDVLRRAVSALARTAAVAALAGAAVALSASAAGAAVGPYLTTASPNLNVRSGPSTADSGVGAPLPYHTSIMIVCQTTGGDVNGSSIWDEIAAGEYVADYWVNTPDFGKYSPGIPVCGSPATYLTTASPNLNVRSGPSTADSTVGSPLPYHTQVTIACQTTGASIDGSAIWDEIGSGRYVSDYWVNTPDFGTYSPGLSVCSGTPTGGAGKIGLRVGDNPFPAGQCTWGADNLAHLFMDTDSSAYPAGHNFIDVWGNALNWASSAAGNGWTVVTTPHRDSIVVFQPGVQGADAPYGHVAWVTAVYSNGTFQIEEMNATAGANYDFRKVAVASGESFILIPPFS
jgi:surface antigen